LFDVLEILKIKSQVFQKAQVLYGTRLISFPSQGPSFEDFDKDDFTSTLYTTSSSERLTEIIDSEGKLLSHTFRR
jgi:hypothetical protein